MPASRSPFAPLLVWALPQAAVLILAATQAPFLPAKSMPHPAELLTLKLMLGVQIVFASLTFPLLFRDRRASLIVILTALPMTLIATFFSGEMAKGRMIYSIAYVFIWLVGLALWCTICRSRRSSAIGIGTAVLISTGTLVFDYVRAEYGSGCTANHWDDFNPVMSAIAASNDGTLSRRRWIFLIGFLLAGALAAVAHREIVRRRHATVPTAEQA